MIDIRDPAAIDAAWLTRVLQHGGVDAVVRSFTARNVGTGQIGDSIRFTLTYERGADGAPASLVGKFPSSGAESRAAGVGLGNYMREVNFYRHLAASALIHTPRCWFTDIDPATHAFVLMMEDLAPAEQGDQLAGVGVETAHLVLGEAARLHASHWGDDSIDELPWVQGSKHATSPVSGELVGGLWKGFVDRYGARVTPAARAIGEAMAAGFGAPDERTGPRCLIHNDFRPDNMMFATPAGGYPMTTLDWQSVGYGRGGADVGYFIAGALTPALRRAHSAALLDGYLATMRSLGADYAAADFAADVIAGARQLFLTAFFAAMVVTQTQRGDDMFFVMLNGAVDTIVDAGT